MYHLEDNNDHHVGFTTIPAGIYWAIQTLFTIGYGDIVPVTYGGRMFAGLFMMFGASVICIPLLSIIAKFQENWDEDKSDDDTYNISGDNNNNSASGGGVNLQRGSTRRASRASKRI